MKLLTLPLLAAFVFTSPVVVLWSNHAEAGVKGDANNILAAVDKRAEVFRDQTYSAAMEVYKGGKLKKVLEFDMTMKGLDKQLIIFKAPGDVAGMKVLMEDADTLYMYSPEFKKARLIAAHLQSQGFLGSEFTYEDMAMAKLSNQFDAMLLGKTGSLTTLELTLKPGKTSSYAKLEIVIDSTKGGVTEVRYFDTAGHKIREQVREEWEKVDGQPMPTKVSVKNLKTGNTTAIKLSNVKVNQNVPNELFSRRILMRGT